MKRLSLLLAGGALVLACGDGNLVDLTPPPPPAPTFVIFGIVEDEEGLPIGDATAQLIRSGSLTLSSITNASGHFSFSEVRGPVTLLVEKIGFTREQRFLDVTEDVLSRVRLIRLFPDAVLILGTTITAAVQAGAPPCDPVGWDAEAPCRRFAFTAPASGKLVITLNWSGSPELDATLVTGGGNYVAFSTGAGPEQAILESAVAAGQHYELRVNAYYGSQDFQLRAELIQ